MFCRTCKNEVSGNASTCTQCGSKPKTPGQYCFNCGESVSTTAGSCPKCGENLSPDSLPKNAMIIGILHLTAAFFALTWVFIAVSIWFSIIGMFATIITTITFGIGFLSYFCVVCSFGAGILPLASTILNVIAGIGFLQGNRKLARMGNHGAILAIVDIINFSFVETILGIVIIVMRDDEVKTWLKESE